LEPLFFKKCLFECRIGLQIAFELNPVGLLHLIVEIQ
jgi:hypothetical protein